VRGFAVVKIHLKAVIGKHTFNDVVQFTSTFAMNAIPVASLLVAVGRNAETQKLATIHSAIPDLKVNTKVEVFLRTEITSSEEVKDKDVGVPKDGEIKIFEGKIVGMGWRRTNMGAHFTIHCLHWLGDLNYASAGSASLHPGGMAALAAPAVFPAIGPGVGAGAGGVAAAGNPAWVPMLNKDFVGVDGLSDIWGRVLHAWMKQIAKDDPFESSLPGGNAGGGDENTLAALDRMGPNEEGEVLDVSLDGADAFTVQDGIATALINESGSNWINTTLWGKLVGEWAPAYWFSVIPRVEDCLIVPFTGGLQGKPWAVIGDEDYVHADMNAQLHQVLRAVWIAYPPGWYSGADLLKGRIGIDQTGAAGVYGPDGLENGMVLIKDAPKWLSDPLVIRAHSRTAEGMGDNGAEPINTAVDEKDVGKPRKPPRDFEDIMKRHRRIINNYAHQWYILESLKGRVGEVSGKLRFDISPGSNVLVEAGGAKNVPAADAIQVKIFATVMSVTTVINAESQKAGTAFTLAHIRTEPENGDAATSISKPPLYETAWPGAVLVAGVKPEGE